MLEHCHHRQDLTWYTLKWNLKRIKCHVVFFHPCYIPLGHGVKQILNAGILPPTVFE